MRTVAIVQARMSSTRLPGKCLAEIAGHPLLWHTVTRTRAARALDDVFVATSRESSDDPIEIFCRREEIPLFRGDLEDVLDRYHGAAEHSRADRIVRVTADCPVLRPARCGSSVAPVPVPSRPTLTGTRFPRAAIYHAFY